MKTRLTPNSHIYVIFPYTILFRSSVISMLVTLKKNYVPHPLIFLCYRWEPICVPWKWENVSDEDCWACNGKQGRKRKPRSDEAQRHYGIGEKITEMVNVHSTETIYTSCYSTTVRREARKRTAEDIPELSPVTT